MVPDEKGIRATSPELRSMGGRLPKAIPMTMENVDHVDMVHMENVDRLSGVEQLSLESK